MKRTLFGMLVMSSVVGLGSLGVYYAQQHLAPKTAAAEQPDQAALEGARDLTPVPIPIAKRAEPAPATVPGASNPFVGRTSIKADVVADRYQMPEDSGADVDNGAVEQTATNVEQYAADEYANDEDSAARYAAEEDTAGEIPDADRLAVYDKPARSTSAADPYAERPAAAEVIEETAKEPADESAPPSDDEPRRLSPAAATAESDRYGKLPGNPLRGQSNAPSEQQPVDKRYAAEEYPAENTESPDAPKQQPVAAQPPAAGRLADDAGSFNQPATDQGTGRPGDPSLSGAQSPALTIEKLAPPEIQIGKPAKFVIKVRNVGGAAAHGVEVHDVIPQGTQLLDTTPPAQPGPDAKLVWELGTLKPSEEKTVEMQLMPTTEGEIGSVATVHFHAEASVRTVATRPMLDIEVFGPSKVNKDQQLALRIKLSNPGSGAATGVVLTEIVPKGLAHQEGKELELDLGTLKPGELRELDLTLVAVEAGLVTNIVTVAADGKLHAESRTEIEVVAPQLQVSLSGPKRRYLERNATHSISVSNPGTAPARDIDLVAVLPRTLKFVEANNGGQFDEATHAVYWSLEELPPQETGTVKLTTLPLEAGDAKLLIKSSSKDGLQDEREEVVSIEGLAAINFQLSDLKDPIEMGGETAYEIRVTNQGTKAASNVRIVVLVPRGMQPLAAEGPVRYKIEGQHVLFEPIKQLAPKADTSFTIKVKAIEPGDQRVEVQVATDEIPDPISKEESTRVYGDE